MARKNPLADKSHKDLQRMFARGEITKGRLRKEMARRERKEPTTFIVDEYHPHLEGAVDQFHATDWQEMNPPGYPGVKVDTFKKDMDDDDFFKIVAFPFREAGKDMWRALTVPPGTKGKLYFPQAAECTTLKGALGALVAKLSVLSTNEILGIEDDDVGTVPDVLETYAYFQDGKPQHFAVVSGVYEDDGELKVYYRILDSTKMLSPKKATHIRSVRSFNQSFKPYDLGDWQSYRKQDLQEAIKTSSIKITHKE